MPGKAPGGINERQNRNAEFIGQLHESLGLAIAFGSRHAEVALGARGEVATLLMADDHERASLVCRQTTDDGGIVAITTIAVQLDEAGKHVLDIVQRVRPLGMPGQFDLVPDSLVQMTAAPQILEALAYFCYLIFEMNAGKRWQAL